MRSDSVGTETLQPSSVKSCESLLSMEMERWRFGLDLD